MASWKFLEGNIITDRNMCVLGIEKDYCTWDESGIYTNVAHYFKGSEDPRWKNLLEKYSNGNSYIAYSGSLTVQHF